MQDLIISINKNTLRVSNIDREASLRTIVAEIPKEIVDETRIIDPQGLSDILGNLIPQVSSLNKNKLSLNFLMEPQDVFLRFITVSKNGSDVNDQVVSEIKAKDPNLPLDQLYFSYKKIAPFVYQFVGVRKDVIDSYMEVSNKLGIGLKSIIPWVLTLPKYEGVNDPAIFITKLDGEQIIALSELNGIFFAGTYQKEKTSGELESLIKDLSFYKRSSPIKCIFTLNCDSFSMAGFDIKKISTPEFKSQSSVPSGFEQNTIVNFLLDSDPEIVNSQLNMLNLLPMPVVERKSSALVIAGSAVGALVLLVGAYFGIKLIGSKNSSDSQMAQENTQESSVVLGGNTSTQPSNSIENPSGENAATQDNDPNLEIKKSNLKIRVENGAGIGGLAARTKEFLEGFGYTVLTIDTASSKVEKTVLTFKKGAVEDFKTLVTKDLEEKFPEIEVKDDLGEDKDYDLLIIVGTSSEL